MLFSPGLCCSGDKRNHMRLVVLYTIGALLCNVTTDALGQELSDTVPQTVVDTFPGYPDPGEPTIPTDVEADLDNSFPTLGAAFGTIVPRKWFNWKSALYDKTGLKFGMSYQTLYTYSTGTISDDSASDGWGGWFLLEAQWKAFNKDSDWEGSLNFGLDARHKLGGGEIPGNLIFDAGAAIDATYLPWDPYALILFWEQHGPRDQLWIRFGQIATPSVLDFFRFKDSRVSFLSPSLTLPLNSIPYSAPGLGLAFRFSLIEGSGMYISGAVNDLNSQPGKFDWSGLFDYGEVFAGLEFGKNWVRSKTDFDHVHIMVFYADERSSFETLPTESGWGFKIHGSRQWNKVVGFANYTFNTVEGGGFGLFTVADHAATLGVVRMNPFKIRGELGGAFHMANPMTERAELLGGRTEPQYGAEVYWRVLVLKQLWVTPGFQCFINPTFNLRDDFFVAPSIKARVFF